ncbi:RloB family protein [Brachybacterium alimentarium]|uniref:RloB family protein n=1 Tax=Brachybacterium alimentarium TaxID=47845 RepID=UPI003FD4863D
MGRGLLAGRSPRSRRSSKRSLLIATNGALTEQSYLKEIKQLARDAGLAIRVEFVNGEPDSMVRKLSSPHGDTGEYDEVWIVVDEDGRDRMPLLRTCAKKSSAKQPWYLVVSRPCFEVWLIAHYARVRRYVDQQDAQHHYRSLVPSDLHEKELPRDFPYSAVAEAIDRSRLADDEQGEVDSLPPSPGTGMPHLVTRLGLVQE